MNTPIKQKAYVIVRPDPTNRARLEFVQGPVAGLDMQHGRHWFTCAPLYAETFTQPAGARNLLAMGKDLDKKDGEKRYAEARVALLNVTAEVIDE